MSEHIHTEEQLRRLSNAIKQNGQAPIHPSVLAKAREAQNPQLAAMLRQVGLSVDDDDVDSNEAAGFN